jgi:hypothetical protein
MKKKATSIQMAPSLLDKVAAEAKKESRSIANMICVILQKYFDAKK